MSCGLPAPCKSPAGAGSGVAAVSIRAAVQDDAAAVAELLGQLGYLSSTEAVRTRLAVMRESNDLVFVAEAGRVVGMIALNIVPAIERDGPVARLGALVVDEGFRGQRIGERLVDRAGAEARARGCSLFYVTSASHRSRAHSFYLRLGFAQTGLRFARQL